MLNLDAHSLISPNQITKKVRVSERSVRVNARVVERKVRPTLSDAACGHDRALADVLNRALAGEQKWAKFGDCAGMPAGPERGVTNVGEEVVLERTKDAATKPSKAQQAVAPVGVYRRRVGAEFITGKDRTGGANPDEPTPSEQSEGGPKKFVVPAKRSGGKMEGDSMRGKRGTHESTRAMARASFVRSFVRLLTRSLAPVR